MRKAHPITLWTGRVLGTIASLFWLIVLALHGMIGPAAAGTSPDLEGRWLSILIIVGSVAVGISWKWTGWGGPLVLASGLALALFAVISAGQNQVIAVLVSGFPFLLAGTLMTLSTRLTGD